MLRPETFQQVATIIKRSKILSRVVIAHNEIEHKEGGNKQDLVAIKALCDALTANMSLLDLDMSSMNISNATIRQISLVLVKNKTLQRLSLDHNRISDEGAKHVRLLPFPHVFLTPHSWQWR